MIKNALKVSFRNFFREKFHTLSNVLGLATGLVCAIFLTLYIVDELSYDKFHVNAKNIYRVVSEHTTPEDHYTWASTQGALGPELQASYSDIPKSVRLAEINARLKFGPHTFFEDNMYVADSTMFDVFTHKVLEGDLEGALRDPGTMVMTASMANRYFVDESPLGKSIMVVEFGIELRITAVIEDLPKNSHLSFDGLVSMSTAGGAYSGWGRYNVYTYILASNGTPLSSLIENLRDVQETHLTQREGNSMDYQLQRITDIHLKSKLDEEAESGGDMSYIYLFEALTIFVLLIACINYMNLSTARSSQRLKEIGIRKTLGSTRKQLISQFLIESLLISFFAVSVSIIVVLALLPQFNDLSMKSFTIDHVLNPGLLTALVGTMIVVGLVAGSYPALYLSAFKPGRILKGESISSKGGLRRSLVVFQLFISSAMLISTMVVYDQLEFLRSKDLGFDKEQVVRLTLSRNNLSQFPVFRNKLSTLPNIIDVSSSDSSPGFQLPTYGSRPVESNEGDMVPRDFQAFDADYDHLNVLGMKVVSGRNFSREFASDSLSVLVNEALAKRMNWEEPLNKKIEFSDNQYKVVGVIEDFHQSSLYDEIGPIVVFLYQNNRYAHIKIKGEDIQQELASIETVWNEQFEGDPFDFQFLDADLDSQYGADQRRGRIFLIFSVMTILIACLGLLGLAAYTTEQRRKEFGIRKVLGSGVQRIVMLASKEFVILASIAILISVPVAYYFMDNWLEAFAYKIKMSGEIDTFLISGVTVVMVTFASVGFYSFRAAYVNPVESLKEE